MKKIITALLCCVFLVGAVGCGNQADKDIQLMTDAITTMFTSTGESINEYFLWLDSDEVMVKTEDANMATVDINVVIAKNKETFGEFFSDKGLEQGMNNNYLPVGMWTVMYHEDFISSEVTSTSVTGTEQEGQFIYTAEITVIDANNETVIKEIDGEMALDKETGLINSMTLRIK